MNKIVWSPKATETLEEIHNYIAKDSKKYANQVILKIFELVEKISLNPNSGRTVREYKNLDLKERRYGNYRIIYRSKNEGIEVVAIFHTAQIAEWQEVLLENE